MSGYPKYIKERIIPVTAPDARGYPRKSACFFMVFNRHGKGGEPALPHIGYTRDISAGGAFFFTRGEAEQGDDLSLKFHLPADWGAGDYPPSLEGNGKVQRVETNRKLLPLGYINGVAVRFTEELDIAF